jgi:hypothetical protein
VSVEVLPTRKRVELAYASSGFGYPNVLTLDSIVREIGVRIADGFTPVEAFLTVADGVRNWYAAEPDLTKKGPARMTPPGPVSHRSEDPHGRIEH